MRFTVEPLSRLSRRAALTLSVAMVASGVALGAAHAQDKAAMLLPGSVNDQSWNAIGFAALNKLKEAGADRWEKVKEGVGSAFDDLKKVLE